ncbi:hypothetical protein DFH07DRAFT_846758 [Mycena maculata]|uniref:Zn(2)-C6 fungal-type domain-containing protein n=1 Tax=Mycena maculata TaxID=230809 RepID=A0AAD7I1Q0_9AGAR|nr:hypothetical protein DFH07DRAFT_846758 [Mycena maculata]
MWSARSLERHSLSQTACPRLNCLEWIWCRLELLKITAHSVSESHLEGCGYGLRPLRCVFFGRPFLQNHLLLPIGDTTTRYHRLFKTSPKIKIKCITESQDATCRRCQDHGLLCRYIPTEKKRTLQKHEAIRAFGVRGAWSPSIPYEEQTDHGQAARHVCRHRSQSSGVQFRGQWVSLKVPALATQSHLPFANPQQSYPYNSKMGTPKCCGGVSLKFELVQFLQWERDQSVATLRLSAGTILLLRWIPIGNNYVRVGRGLNDSEFAPEGGVSPDV